MPHAFISYPHIKKATAIKIQQSLEKIGKKWFLFGKSDITVYRDQTDMNLTASLPDSIKDLLNDSDFLILLASAITPTRDWITQELLHWLDKKAPDDILIIILDGKYDWKDNDFDWETTDCIPPILKGHFAKMPLFVDLRDLPLRGNKFFSRLSQHSGIVQLAGRILNKTPRQLANTEIKHLLKFSGTSLIPLIVIGYLYNTNIESNKTISNQKIDMDRQAIESATRQMKIDLDEIDNYILDGEAYYRANLFSLADTAFRSAYQIASKKTLDTVSTIKGTKEKLKHYIQQCHDKSSVK